MIIFFGESNFMAKVPTTVDLRPNSKYMAEGGYGNPDPADWEKYRVRDNQFGKMFSERYNNCYCVLPRMVNQKGCLCIT